MKTTDIITMPAVATTALATVILARCTFLYLEETKKMRDVAEKELRIRNKPMVGIEGINPIAGVNEKENFGKKVFWNNAKKEFYSDDLPVSVTGVQFNIKIKNFGTEPATKVLLDPELWIDNTLMPKTVTEELGNIIMPTQQISNLAN